LTSEWQPLTREVLVSLGRSPEIVVPVYLGETTSFVFDLAEHFGLLAAGRRLWVYARQNRSVCTLTDALAWFRRRHAADNHFVQARVEFNTETKQNILGATVWRDLFPSDFQEQRSLFVPLLGRVLWRRFVSEGKISKDATISAIDVETEEYRVFDNMLEGLSWAESLGKPTVYFNRYEPGFWRVDLGMTHGHED
jgi:hypothetical protein